MLINLRHPVKITRQETFFPTWDCYYFHDEESEELKTRRVKEEKKDNQNEEEIWRPEQQKKKISSQHYRLTREFCDVTSITAKTSGKINSVETAGSFFFIFLLTRTPKKNFRRQLEGRWECSYLPSSDVLELQTKKDARLINSLFFFFQNLPTSD